MKNGFLIVLTIGLLYVIFLRECRSVKCPPEGHRLVTAAFIDSLKAVADKPPVIIVKDTVIYQKKIVYVYTNIPEPEPFPMDSVVYNVYLDSIYNDSIRVWNKLWVDGTVDRWDKWYKPIIHQREITKEVRVPYPVENEVPVKRSGLYLSGLLGSDGVDFGYGASLDLINKKDYLYGLQYQRIGNQSLYSFRIGMRLKLKN